MHALARRRHMLHRFCQASLLALLPMPAFALDFVFPAQASQTILRQDALSSYALPIGPFKNGAMQTSLLEGGVLQTVWRLPTKDQTTLQILIPLRDQLTAAGFRNLYECDTAACGGFDFRFGADIAAEPAMHIDLGDFRFLAASRDGPDGPEHVSIFVSRSSTLGFVQITQVGKGQPAVQSVETPAAQPVLPVPQAQPTTSMGDGLAQQGSVALDDLIFASGAADLAPGDYASLDALADFLRTNPQAKVSLVGHTDASGGLTGNITLSKARAASVRAWMIKTYALPAEQLTAEGVGYLAPRDSNVTDQGRTRNRRVEAMLLVNP